jgi:predicted transcriptional regulator
MTLEEIQRLLKAEVIAGEEWINREIKCACGSDLMSDVLAFIKNSTLLVTGLANPQVIRTAEMADIIAIVFVRGKKPDFVTIEMAQEKGVPLLLTELTMFETCGILYKAGLSAC